MKIHIIVVQEGDGIIRPENAAVGRKSGQHKMPRFLKKLMKKIAPAEAGA